MRNWKESNKRLDVFENTLQVCEREFALIRTIEHSRNNTVVWEHPMEDIVVGENRYETPCKVGEEKQAVFSTVQCLRQEFPACRLGILNCASPIHAGGVVIHGGDGPEELLCRTTTLYPCLDTEYLREEYYEKNRSPKMSLYRDACIYIPDVMWFKGCEPEEVCFDKEKRFLIDVICCTFPRVGDVGQSFNLSGRQGEEVRIQEFAMVLSGRIEGVLKVAIQHKIEVLVLNAIGFEDYGYTADWITEQCKKALQKYSYFFRAVHLVL